MSNVESTPVVQDPSDLCDQFLIAVDEVLGDEPINPERLHEAVVEARTKVRGGLAAFNYMNDNKLFPEQQING